METNKMYCLFSFQILDLLGPKTAADLAPPPKVEKKSKGADTGKKTKKEENKGNSYLFSSGRCEKCTIMLLK